MSETKKCIVEEDEKAEKNEPSSSYETLLGFVKSDGPYQWKLILLFMLPLAFVYAIAERNRILLYSTPDHVCHVPGRSATNYTLEEWHNITIPWITTQKGEQKLDSCRQYDGVQFTPENANLPTIRFNKSNIIECQHGYDYDTSTWSETPISKFNLVCENTFYVKRLFGNGLMGSTVGTLVFAILADRFGRRPVFFFLVCLNTIFGTAAAFAENYITFYIIQFVAALAFIPLYHVPYILVQEVCNQKLRYVNAVLSMSAFVLATGFDSFISWVLGNWKTFLYVTHLPSIIFIFYWKFLPESPRWLISKGKFDECQKVMNKIAKTNGVHYTEDMKQLLFQAKEEEEKKKIPIKKVFSSFVLTKHLFLLSTILSCCYMFAGGINFNVHMMLGSVMVNYFILRSFEFPGNFLGNFSCAYFGRKITCYVGMGLGCVCIIAASFFIKDRWASVILCGMAKMFVRATIYAVYLLLGELFPTALRSSAFGIANVVAIASIIVAPTIIYLGLTNITAPYYIWCAIGIAGVVLSIFLPETLDLPLPQTIKDAMEIGQNQSYFSIIHKWNVHRYNKPVTGGNTDKTKKETALL